MNLGQLRIESIAPTWLVLHQAPSLSVAVCGQCAENPQLVQRPDGSYLASFIGINAADFASGLRGESLYTAELAFGIYAPWASGKPALAFAPAIPPATWGVTGGFGGGAALFALPAGEEPCADHSRYFAAINLGNFALRRYGFVWASSPDGIAWHIDGGKPETAIYFLHREDYGADQPMTGGSIWHPSGYYRNGHFYLLFGYSTPAAGIQVQCYRIAFDRSKPLGFGALEMLTPDGFVPHNGILNSWHPAVPGAADMMCAVPLARIDGTDGGLLAVYNASSRGMFDSVYAYRHSRTSVPPFEWSEQHSITEGPLARVPLTRQTTGGPAIGLVQMPFSEATGCIRLLGLVAGAPATCPYNTTALLPVMVTEDAHGT